MARAIKQGQHIFIAFQDGEAVLDSQLRPRMYKSREQFEKSFPAWRDGKAELVEYAPTLPQPSNEALALEYREYRCAECGHEWMEDCDATDYPNYCPGCGNELRRPPEEEA